MEIILFFAGILVFWLISVVAVGIIFRNSEPDTSHAETKASINKVYKPRLNQNEFDKLSSTKIAATLNKTTKLRN
jgi:hypothetical protein